MNNKQARKNYFERFIEFMEDILNSPKLMDPTLQRKAQIIHILSSLTLVIGIATLALTPLVFDNTLRGLSITGGIMLIILLVQVLNRRGYTNLAARLFVGSIWIFDVALILYSGGFNSKIFSSFISISIMGGLILGELYTMHLAGISLIAYLVFFLIEAQGMTPKLLIVLNPFSIILINSINLVLASVVLSIVILRHEQNFRELQDKEKDLGSANLDLMQQINAREEAESQLRLSENRFKSALMESPYPTMLHAQNGEILLVNTAWANDSGYSPDKLPIYADWLDHMFREDSHRVIEIIDQLLAGEDIKSDGFFEIYKENGETLKWYLRWTMLPALSDGRILFLTVATDFTGVMNIESTLRDREETLSRFALVTNDGLWDWDLKTDQVMFDPLYYTMAGYEVDEFPHELEEFRKRVHPDDVGKVFSHAEDYLTGKADIFNIEFRFLQKDASWLWIMGRGKITEQDENGNPHRFVGTHTDISAQKQIEEALSNYQLQLEDIVDYRTQELNERITEVERLNIALTNILDDYQAANEKLSILGNTLSTANQELESLSLSLSTDLMQPITTIQETAAKLIKNKSKGQSGKELDSIKKIQETADRVNQQISNLLRISQLSLQELQLEELDPAILVQKTLRSFAKEIKEKKIKTDVKDLPACYADRELLELVFENLISNGIKYSASQETPEIQIGYQPDQSSSRVIYYVEDNGIGFDQETKDLVFGKLEEPPGEKYRKGTGIGLTLAKLIINKHNGRIWAESEEGKGATFYFDLASPDENEEY